MKKKTFFTILTVFVTIILIGSTAFLVNSIYKYSQTVNKYKTIDEEKAVEINNEENFVNTAEKYNNKEVESQKIKGYTYIYDYNDILFISYSEHWDKEKLEELAKELYKNKHGEEINYISRVEVIEGEDEEYLGYHQQTKENYTIPISFYNFLPSDATYIMKSQLSRITLTGAEKKQTIEDMARTLSHEYGHHFAEYYFGLKNDVLDRKTEYFKLRNDEDLHIFTSRESWDMYLQYHMWYLAELAAEDYVYLMGSETTKKVFDFYDAKQRVKYYATNEAKYNETNYSYKDCKNVIPHENSVLKMPHQVEGLAEYFYSFIDEPVRTFTETQPIGDLSLSLKQTSSHNYTVNWDMPYTSKDVVYTLIVYGSDDILWFAVKTVHGNEQGEAYLGKYEYTKGAWIYSYSTNLKKDTELKLRVSITFPDSTVILSDAVDLVY